MRVLSYGCIWELGKKWLGVTFKFQEDLFFRNTQNVSVIYKRTN